MNKILIVIKQPLCIWTQSWIGQSSLIRVLSHLYNKWLAASTAPKTLPFGRDHHVLWLNFSLYLVRDSCAHAYTLLYLISQTIVPHESRLRIGLVFRKKIAI